MEVVNGLENVTREPGAAVTVGSFDGVHLGHQRILRRMREYGHKPLTVMTFDPHPQMVVRPYGDPPPQLTTFEERRMLFEKLGVDRLVIVHFDAAFAGISAREFIEQVLLRKVGMSRMFIGPTHGFGAGRLGNADMLSDMADKNGFDVEIIPPVVRGGRYVSSSRIRKCLQAGDSYSAMHFLGRPYYLRGEVISGEGRGRRLGFPTANLDPGRLPKLFPAPGVYASVTEVDGRRFPSVTHFGNRPTFADTRPSLETYIFGFDVDIHGDHIAVGLIERLRGVKSFETPAQLTDQLRRDGDAAMIKIIERGFGNHAGFPERLLGETSRINS